MNAHRSVFISGGGPAGLAAALMFDRLGWGEIVMVERRPSPSSFEKNKSFNYLVDPRGQRMLDRLGILDRIEDFGVGTRSFKPTTVSPDGKAVSKTVPIIDPDRPTCYWTTRRALLTMLYGAITDHASDRVRILYGHDFTGLERDSDGRILARARASDGIEITTRPDLILACDGLNSTMRKAFEMQPEVPEGHFAMCGQPSLSTGLRYKVLNLPSTFAAGDGSVRIDDSRTSYIFPSRHKSRNKACALFAFPVVDPDHPRSVNLIREADHDLWKISDADSLLDFLRDSFPQLDVDVLIPRAEAEDFVALEPGQFPVPQYAANIHAEIGPADAPTQCLVIGDAAHAFPPDLGLGVNAALQDLDLLAADLEAEPDLAAATRAYAARRLPESRDLVYLVRTTFPEQYNHRPIRLAIWALGFFARRRLNSWAPSLFDPPAFFLTQHPTMSFGEMRRLKRRTDLRVRLLGLALLLALVALLVALLT